MSNETLLLNDDKNLIKNQEESIDKMKIEQQEDNNDCIVDTNDGCLQEKSSSIKIIINENNNSNGDVSTMIKPQSILDDCESINDQNLDTTTTISDTQSESSTTTTTNSDDNNVNNDDDNDDHHQQMAGILNIMSNNDNQSNDETITANIGGINRDKLGQQQQQLSTTHNMTLTANHKQQQVPPFPLLAGESLLHYETTNEYQIFLTNYRFFVKNIPHKHRSTIISQVPPTSSSMITMNGGTSAVSYQNGLNGHVTIMNNNNSNNKHCNQNQLNHLQQPQQNDRNNYHQQNHHHYHHQNNENQPKQFFIPINNIDWIEIREIYFLTIYTKYIESFVLTFDNQESVQQWHKRLCDIQQIDIKHLFCFQFYRELFATTTANNNNNTTIVNNNHHNQQQQIDNKFIDLFLNNQNVIEKMYRQSDRLIRQEFQRMKFDQQSWRICDLNKDFKFSYSYPEYFIVPNDITDNDLEYVANFRYSRRIPVVVWRNNHNGCVIMRSSQPVVGWFGCRCNQDERMLQTVLKICQHDTIQYRFIMDNNNLVMTKINGDIIVNNGTLKLNNGTIGNGLDHQIINKTAMNGGNLNGNKTMANGNGQAKLLNNNIQNHSDKDQDHSSNDSSNDDDDDDDDNSSNDDNDQSNNNNKLLILDARSYTAAFANRAMGGGCECPEYYTNCDVQFMGLNNIHSIRKSFYSLRYICESSQIDQSNWYTMLDNTKWLHNLASLLKAAVVVVDAITIQERPVLVHCSDGWDRTPQVIALAELMLDPFYRTIDGFKILVEKEWLQYGHKFADRCRSSTLNIDPNERCPVFLQWVDCVHQLVKQFPREFEFNVCYLMKLVYHSYSCLFGTFTCNNVQERNSLQVYDKTISLWSYFEMNRANFINYLYLPTIEVLRPSCRVKDIIFWNEIYVPVSNNGTDVTNMAISSCNGICNSTASNATAIVSTANRSTSDQQQYDCDHETKCQSQSKCDLNRSASYESLANSDLKQPAPPPPPQPSTISDNCNNLPSLKQFDQYFNRISTTTIPPILSSSSIMTRHLSDTCLFKRSNQIMNNNVMMATPYMTNGFMIGDNHINHDMEEMVKQRQSPMMNDMSNNNIGQHDIEDCHLITNISNHFNHPSTTMTLSSNKPIYTNCNGLSSPSSKMMNNSSTSIDSLSTIFDIDGQIIGHNNNSRLQLHQLINYHKNMIKRLTNQLNFKK